MLPPTLITNVKFLMGMPRFFFKIVWSCSSFSPIKLLRTKALEEVLCLLIISRNPCMTAMLSQQFPVRVLRSEASIVLFITTVPSGFANKSLLNCSIRPLSGWQFSFGGETDVWIQCFSWFTLAETFRRWWTFSKVLINDWSKISNRTKPPWTFQCLNYAAIIHM